MGRGEGNWAEITLVKTFGAVTKDREKFGQKLGASNKQLREAFLLLSPSHF